MNAKIQNVKIWLALLTSITLVGCGGSGDEYDGFDAEVTVSTPDNYLTYFNSQGGEFDQSYFAEAYYRAIDPGNARTTMQDYIALHGLDNPDVHVIFRDSKDLGYGRDMYMNSYPNPSSCGGQIIAFMVRNFSVQIVEGFAYGPVNLEAAIEDDVQHHVGTNAIEFGLGRADMGDPCSSEPIAKFYTYRPVYNPANAAHPRRIRVDLDGRGTKAMPQPCITCHGGKLRPLDRHGRFVAMHADDMHTHPLNPGDISDIGNTKARLQAFEVDTFEFLDQPGYSRADSEEGLRLLNAAIFCTYPGSFGDPACDAHAPTGVPGTGGVAARTPAIDSDNGEWSGDFARDMLQGWYGNALGVPGSRFDVDYVPVGWTPSVGGPPVGADTLFLKVVGPNCFVCHGKQGTQLGTNSDASGDGKDIDFSTWDKFISYADDIERLVYDEGKMPLGLLNYQTFWNDPEKGELLASFIAPSVSDPAGFNARRIDANGAIPQPGRIVARAGADRVTQQNAAITLNAQATLFANSYRWQLISAPPGALVSLSSPTAVRTDFSADTDGDYVVRMTASTSESAASRSDTVTIVVDNTLPIAPRDLVFYNDVTPADSISAFMTPLCTDCHSTAGASPVAGIPVWWTADATQGSVGAPPGIPVLATDSPALGLYEQVLARVNLAFIEDSRLLKKPSGQHHYGDLVNGPNGGLDDSLPVGAAGRADYDMLLNWASEGAACGLVGDSRCPD